MRRTLSTGTIVPFTIKCVSPLVVIEMASTIPDFFAPVESTYSTERPRRLLACACSDELFSEFKVLLKSLKLF